MKRETLICKDSHTLYYHVWEPKEEAVAILHIQHGMAEHSARYDDFAQFLNSKKIKVYAQDHRGHGYTGDKEVLGFFAEKNGWDTVLSDAKELSIKIKEENPNIPLILMGHSMGSFIARCLTSYNPDLYKASIFMGTAPSAGIKGIIGKKFAKSRIKKLGSHFIDKTLNNMTFAAYNNKFDPNGSPFQWLSRDEDQVKKYEEDPWCGFVCSSSFYYDIIDGIQRSNNLKLIKNIDKSYPILLISGSMDPVGNFGKGIQRVKKLYEKAGLTSVDMNLINDGRHEVLNETDKQNTYDYLYSWISDKIK